MWVLAGILLLIVVLAVGGFLLGTRRSQRRERELTARLTERNEELQAARAELARLTSLDGLTRLASSDYFQQFLEREWRRALRELTPLSLMMLDLDHFKTYNERLGHQAGDDCLKRVATVLRDAVGRPGDLVARHGGEEFIVALARTDAVGVQALATKLRTAIEDLQLEHPASPVAGHVTVSIGVVTAVPSRSVTWQEIELVAAAGRALAEAKRLGRNRVERAEFVSDNVAKGG